MSLVKATIKTSIKSILTRSFDEKTDPSILTDDFADQLADVIIAAIQSATVTVPATGLVAPSGGGPVTGISTTGSLS